MSSLIEVLKTKSNLYYGEPASDEQIEHAEASLGIRFADDYKDYLSHYGMVSCGGHELTGIGKDENLNVVKTTAENKIKNPNIIIPLYVVEETHLDGIVIWQTESGEIYETSYKGSPKKIYNSLMEYISTFTDQEGLIVSNPTENLPKVKKQNLLSETQKRQTAKNRWKSFWRKLFGG